MAHIKHNKLVRDRILDSIALSGASATSRIIKNDTEYLEELCKKLLEEAQEVQAEPSAEELADTLEVIHAIAGQLGITMEDVEKARQTKQKKRGGFSERIFLITTDEPS